MTQEISMGTTLVAVKYNGGILLGTDSMVSSGIVISDRSSKKVMELSPSPKKFGSIKVMRCGVASHSQMVSRMVFNYLNFFCMDLEDNQKLDIKTVVNLYKQIIYGNKKFLQCAFIITNGKDIYTVSSGGAYLQHNLFATNGSGSIYIRGYLNDKLRENMSFYEVREVLLKGMALAINNDGSSGGNIRLTDVKNNGESQDEIILNKEIKNLI